jgi:hypothetical protein
MLHTSLGVAWTRACVCVCNTQADVDAYTGRKLTCALRTLLRTDEGNEAKKKTEGKTHASYIEPTAIVFYVAQTNELHGVFGVTPGAGSALLERRIYCLPVRGEALQDVWPRLDMLESHAMTVPEMRQVLSHFRKLQIAKREGARSVTPPPRDMLAAYLLRIVDDTSDATATTDRSPVLGKDNPVCEGIGSRCCAIIRPPRVQRSA